MSDRRPHAARQLPSWLIFDVGLKMVGDIFSVPLGDGTAALFHHVANDLTQLNSAVIRIFKRRQPQNAIQIPETPADEPIDFHAHVFISVGKKGGVWSKVGHRKVTTEVKAWFRDSNDYGKPEIVVSRDWYVWQANRPSQHVGALEGEMQSSEIGVVIPPSCLVARLKTGHYDFVYPRFR